MSISSGTVVIGSTDQPGDLCLLIKYTPGEAFGKSGIVTPIGRSYDENTWQTQSPLFLEFSCGESRTCAVTLPDGEYRLYFFRHTLSAREEVSRFLTQATFGPTQQSIIDVEGLDADLPAAMELYLFDQMGLEPTYHRKWFRERAREFLIEQIGVVLHFPTLACVKGSRYVRAIFSNRDASDNRPFQYVTREDDEGNTVYHLEVDGFLRGVFDSIPAEMDPDTLYDLESSEGWIGGQYRFDLIAGSSNVDVDGGMVGVNLTHIPDSAWVLDLAPGEEAFFEHTQILGRGVTSEARILTSDLTDANCPTFSESPFASPVAFVQLDGEWYRHERGLAFIENTPENPHPTGLADRLVAGNGECSNVPRAFNNEESCRLSDASDVCKLDQTPPAITLDEETLIALHEATGRYAYIVNGLNHRFGTSACARDPSVDSDGYTVDGTRFYRIENTSACETAGIAANTEAWLKSEIIKVVTDGGKFADFKIPSGTSDDDCHPDTPAMVYIWVAEGEGDDDDDDGCWQHVHRHHRNVYDMTYWTEATNTNDNHPGGAYRIKQWLDPNVAMSARTEPSTSVLEFPNTHNLDRWEDNSPNFVYMGKEGDEVRYQELPNEMQRGALDLFYDDLNSLLEPGLLICGSPNEVQRTEGGEWYWFDHSKDEFNVFGDIALRAADQFRQRMAWAISQIIVVSDVIGNVGPENFGNYQDIFVKNAFGNYRDVLLATSRSAMMGDMLTFINSESRQESYEGSSKSAFPDENFAREFMQLFSIGLVQLEMDGRIVERDGTPVEVYSNEDIMDGARGWTGWRRTPNRGNLEEASNRIDPMRVSRTRSRDQFPKMDLLGGYIGDSYPLCHDRPERAFLRPGAKFILQARYTADYYHWENEYSEIENVTRLELPHASNLRNALCGQDGPTCSADPPAVVVLDSILDCVGIECDIETVNVFQVADGVWYEYMPVPCVKQTFSPSEDLKPVANSGWNRRGTCKHRKALGAWPTCCNEAGNQVLQCEYFNEDVSFDFMTSRCESLGFHECLSNTKSVRSKTTDDAADVQHCYSVTSYYLERFWNNATCEMFAKIDLDSGKVIVVHNLQELEEDDDSVLEIRVSNNTADNDNWFRVEWDGGVYPSASSGATCGAGCTQQLSNECVCPIEVTYEPVFETEPSAEQVTSTALHIGSFPIDMYDDGTFDDPVTLAEGTSYMYTRGGALGMDTVFKVVEKTRTLYFLNVKSMVEVPINSGTYKFRNPVHFQDFGRYKLSSLDVLNEQDAMIDNSFYHNNVPPFVCTRLIQRFGISNPSPDYVLACSTAFATGSYTAPRGRKFGNNKWGDLSATAAAILLHDEARSPTLEADPSWGSLGEPYLRFLRVLRALELQMTELDLSTRFEHIDTLINQMPHRATSVFSFFLPEFKPPSVVGAADLVSPEATNLIGPQVIHLMNGLYSLSKYGWTDCNGGFADEGRCEDEGSWDIIDEFAFGRLTLEDHFVDNSMTAQEIVDELDVLLFNGRLNEDTKQYVVDQVYTDSTLAANGPDFQYRGALQLLLSAPEFHVNNLVRLLPENRPEPASPQESTEPYKATILLFFEGGSDSYNMLVPHTCDDNTAGLRAVYDDVRVGVSLSNNQMSELDTSYKHQDCTFGVHKDLPIYKEMFDAGELAWFTNIGVLFEPSDFSNYKERNPTNLFAHNVQQLETRKYDLRKERQQTGVFGRMGERCLDKGFLTGVGTLDEATAVTGVSGESPDVNRLSRDGALDWNEDPSTPDMREYLMGVNNQSDLMSSLFAEDFSSTFIGGLQQNDFLMDIFDNDEYALSQDFQTTTFAKKFGVISKMIKARELRGKERDLFHLSLGGFDTHDNIETRLSELMIELNEALTLFRDEMTDQGLWDLNITVVTASEFARTLTGNSGEGTDHAWGGNYAVFGGAVKGGQIFGEFPDFYEANSRGRLIPKLSWDHLWNPVCQWFGLDTAEDLDYILPGRYVWGEHMESPRDVFEMNELFN